MNKKDLFWSIQIGKINNKNYRKFKLSKTQFYKVYSRILFFRKIVNPIEMMVLNLSEREFVACKDLKLKTEIISKSKTKSFPHSVEKQSNNQGKTSD